MTNKIDILKYRGNKSSLFTGRPQGITARKELKISEKDKDDNEYVFIIPKGTTSFNPSFFLGLLFDSIKNLGIEQFQNKYSFEYEDGNDEIKTNINENIEDGIRNAKNSIQNNTSFFNFLKNRK